MEMNSPKVQRLYSKHEIFETKMDKDKIKGSVVVLYNSCYPVWSDVSLIISLLSYFSKQNASKTASLLWLN